MHYTVLWLASCEHSMMNLKNEGARECTACVWRNKSIRQPAGWLKHFSSLPIRGLWNAVRICGESDFLQIPTEALFWSRLFRNEMIGYRDDYSWRNLKKHLHNFDKIHPVMTLNLFKKYSCFSTKHNTAFIVDFTLLRVSALFTVHQQAIQYMQAIR